MLDFFCISVLAMYFNKTDLYLYNIIYSNKVWTAADVKEYTWPPPDKADVEHKVQTLT